MKTVISSRYYPSYYGRRSTHRSYRSVYVGAEPAKGSADHIIGVCDDSVPDGWIAGPHGNPIRPGRQPVISGFVAS